MTSAVFRIRHNGIVRQRRLLGPKLREGQHLDTLTAAANLASTHWNQGRWKEVEELKVKVMEARSIVLDEECPDALTAMANLAATYRSHGGWKKVEQLEAKADETKCRLPESQ